MYADIAAVAPRAPWSSFFRRRILSAAENQFFHILLSPDLSLPGFVSIVMPEKAMTLSLGANTYIAALGAGPLDLLFGT
jgi:hypothetical protein